jgi:hypothetical protein
VRYAGARARIIYGTAAALGNALAGWAPATQRAALTASNTTARTFVTNATVLGVAHFNAGGAPEASPFAPAAALGDAYAAVYTMAGGAYGTDISLALRGLDAAWTAGNAVATPAAADNFTVGAMLGEGSYVLRRAPLAAFPAVVDAYGAADPYNADVVVIIDRTPPTPGNVTYAGAAQAVGGAGNFLLPAGVCADAVSSSPALLAVVDVGFVASDGLGYYCPTPAPLAGAHCQAPTVRGPAQDLFPAVTCADEAGNPAVGFVTVPIVAAGA